jgi:hypothetical protein
MIASKFCMSHTRLAACGSIAVPPEGGPYERPPAAVFGRLEQAGFAHGCYYERFLFVCQVFYFLCDSYKRKDLTSDWKCGSLSLSHRGGEGAEALDGTYAVSHSRSRFVLISLCYHCMSHTQKISLDTVS